MTTDLPYRPCVGVMLVNDAGRIWSGQRIDTPGAWQMPQGGIDPGEEPGAAAFRELEEETSLPRSSVEVLAQTPNWLRYDLPPHLVGRLWKGRFRGQEQKWFLMRLTGSESAVRIDTESPEFSTWAWMDFDALLGSIVPFKRPVYEAVWAEFEPLVKANA